VLFRKLHLNWRYGLGELFIVIAGVLIALLAEGWRQDIADRRTEVEYVESLIEDIEADVAVLSNMLVLTEQRAAYGKAVLLTFDTGKRAGVPADFIRAVEFGSYFSYPSYSTSTVDDLRSTGNLKLIRSRDVRDAIARYYSTIEWTEQFGVLHRDVQQELTAMIPGFLSLETRYELFNEGVQASCGPTLSCDRGIPWAESQSLTVSEEDAEEVLRKLLEKRDARGLYANMARIQGSHYSNLSSIKAVAEETVEALSIYLADLKQ